MIRVETFDSIFDVPLAWDHLQSEQTLMQSRKAWQLIEKIHLNDIRCHYLIAYDAEEQPVAAAACYRIVTDIAIFASPCLRKALSWVRRAWPNFLQLSMLECGTPITINPPLAVAASTSPAHVVTAIACALRQLAKQHSAWIVVVRDFEQPEQIQLDAFVAYGYQAVDNLPNTYLTIAWKSIGDFHAAMQSYYRSKLRRMLRKNQTQGITHQLVNDFSELAERLSVQWHAVSARADEYQREQLKPDFYREFSECFGDAARVLLFYRHQEWIAHALLLQDQDTLRWLYYGRDEPCNDGLYVYVGHAVIETAIALGMRQVEMGLTSYPIKRDLGAAMVRTEMAISSPSRLIRPFVGAVYKLLNPSVPVRNRTIFKKADADA